MAWTPAGVDEASVEVGSIPQWTSKSDGNKQANHGMKSLGNTRPGNPAFTLVELLVVIAIIAILAALFIAGLERGKVESATNQVPEQRQTVDTRRLHLF